MGTLTLVITCIAGVLVLFGFIGGLRRGSGRTLFKLILTLIAGVGAFFLKDRVVEKGMSIEVNGQSLKDFIMNNEALKDYAFLADKLEVLVKILVGILVFIVLYFALKFVLWIIYSLFKKPIAKKKRFLGGLLGIVRGAIIALFLLIPLNGLLTQAYKVMNLEMDGKKLGADLSSSMEEIGVDEYFESTTYKILNTVGEKPFDWLTTAKDADGNKVKLTAQVDMIGATLKIADKMTGLTDLNFDGGFTAENTDDILALCQNLDDILNEAGDEAKEALQDFVGSVVEGLGDEFELPEGIADAIGNIDFTTISFASEAESLIGLYECATDMSEGGEMTQEQINGLVENICTSQLILPLMSSMSEGEAMVEIDDQEMKEQFENAIANLPETVDPDMVSSFREMFGLVAE